VSAPIGPDGAEPRRVLVTGAAGLLGRAVLDRLAERRVAVTALVLDDPGDLAAETVVVGDAGDPAVVRRALAGVDAVVHLAAIPAPTLGTDVEVFCGNTRATFVVLTEAARAGVVRAVIASSLSVLGLAWAPRPQRPTYLPVDGDSPLQVADPYALSKQADEATAAMVWRRYGMTVTALRLPFLGAGERLARRAEQLRRSPYGGAAEFWGYLDTRDAAIACHLGLTVPPPGAHVVFVVAPDTLAPYPTEDLLDVFHPDVPRRIRFPGRSVPISSDAAQRVLGFTARHLWPVRQRPLPATLRRHPAPEPGRDAAAPDGGRNAAPDPGRDPSARPPAAPLEQEAALQREGEAS
jgi:nucleoside-diphosphate-sugar epimerase